MTTKEIEEKFVSDDGVSTVEDSVTPEGGVSKPKLADKGLKESINGLFEGTDLSEEFKANVAMVFEAAVTEAVALKVEELKLEQEAALEEAAELMEEKVSDAVAESIEEIVENLDKYLDYAVSEWMEENKLEVESGIKVEMAESLMSGLKTLFEEHNIDVSEETIDIVSELEETNESTKAELNSVLNKNLALKEEVAALKAELVFNDLSEDLSVTQVERLRTLSENLDIDNLDDFTKNVKSLKETFFTDKSATKTTVITEEKESFLTEEAPVARSAYSDIDAMAKVLDKIK